MNRLAVAVLALLLAACGTDASSPAPTTAPSASADPTGAPSITPHASVGTVEPAPGSESAIYAPNPAAVVVAIDAGHGGCLDWGVPDPSERGQAYAEETMTLGIARALRDLLAAEGIGVVMIRDADEALAGDDYPPLDCHGPPWRDVNGDGIAGFGPEVPEGTRTRDELQARLDLANLAAADALVSIHINSPTEGDQRIEIAFSETFYTDETPWGVTETARLAEGIQTGVVDHLAEPRRVRARRPWRQRAELLHGRAPAVRADRGAARSGQAADARRPHAGRPDRGRVDHAARRARSARRRRWARPRAAAGIFDGLAAFFGERELAGRIGLADAGNPEPEAVEGTGPPFWPPVAPDGPVQLRLTNNGTGAWPAGAELVAGWEATDQPYLARAPRAASAVGRRGAGAGAR